MTDNSTDLKLWIMLSCPVRKSEVSVGLVVRSDSDWGGVGICERPGWLAAPGGKDLSGAAWGAPTAAVAAPRAAAVGSCGASVTLRSPALPYLLCNPLLD